MSAAKIVLGVSGVFLVSAAAFVAYDAAVEKSVRWKYEMWNI